MLCWPFGKQRTPETDTRNSTPCDTKPPGPILFPANAMDPECIMVQFQNQGRHYAMTRIGIELPNAVFPDIIELVKKVGIFGPDGRRALIGTSENNRLIVVDQGPGTADFARVKQRAVDLQTCARKQLEMIELTARVVKATAGGYPAPQDETGK